MTDRTRTPADAPTEIAESALDQASGGIAMLLPAVQAAREAARRSQPPANKMGNFEIQD